MTEYYVGIDIHKTEAQVAVIDELGKLVQEVRVKSANLDEIAEKYAGSETAIEAGSNYFTIYDRLDECLDVTLTNPAKADWLANQIQKNDRKDAKNLVRFLRMNETPESYVPPIELRKYRSLARGRTSKTRSTRCSISRESRTAGRCGPMKGVNSAGNSRSKVRCSCCLSSGWKRSMNSP